MSRSPRPLDMRVRDHHSEEDSKPRRRTMIEFLPNEVLPMILRHVCFTDLWSATQHVNRQWREVTRHIILAHSLFISQLRRLDFYRLSHGDPAPGDTTFSDQRIMRHLSDAHWWAVGVHIADATRHYPLFRLSNVLCLHQTTFVRHGRSPFLFSGRIHHHSISYQAQPGRTPEEVELSIAIDDDIPLRIVSYDRRSEELVLDLEPCWKTIFRDADDLEDRRISLVRFLEADIWRPWCEQHVRNRRSNEGASVEAEVLFNQIRSRLLGFDWRMLQQYVEEYDLLVRKIRNYGNMTLHNFENDADLTFASYLQPHLISWLGHDDPVVEIAFLNEVLMISVNMEPAFEKTVALMMKEFDLMHPAQPWAGVITDEEYQEMLEAWQQNLNTRWTAMRNSSFFYIGTEEVRQWCKDRDYLERVIQASKGEIGELELDTATITVSRRQQILADDLGLDVLIMLGYTGPHWTLISNPDHIQEILSFDMKSQIHNPYARI